MNISKMSNTNPVITGPNPLHLREIILNTRKPLILRQFQTNWTCFGESLEEWCAKYDADTERPPEINFERMPLRQGDTPQWERQRERVNYNSLKEFLMAHSTRDQDHWLGLNYKRVTEMPPTCTGDVNFACFGFPHSSDLATFWLSTKGANTPCHYDTYGCNIVVQVYGSKSWLLFPPEATLTSTRIPYEESSVYCMEHFYAPSPGQLNSLQTLQKYAHYCVLNAGDVLIVPRHWWHYVETMEMSLSVNAWIPLKVDAEAQLEECIVKYLMETFTREDTKEALEFILNPNQLDEISEDADLLKLLQQIIARTDDEVKQEPKGKSPPSYDYQFLADDKCEKLIAAQEQIEFVPQISVEKYKQLLETNSKRFANNHQTEKSPPNWPNIKQTLVNSICSPAIVRQIKTELLKRLQDQSEK